MTKQRVLFLLCIGVISGIIYFSFYYQKAPYTETREVNPVGIKNIENEPLQAEEQKEDTQPENDPYSTYKALTENFVSYEDFKKLSPSEQHQVKLDWTPEDVEAVKRRLIEEHDAQMQSPEVRKALLEHPLIQQQIAKYYAWVEERKESKAEMLKLKERLLKQLESLGGVLIYDQNGNPIGYKKDVYGNPIINETPPMIKEVPSETENRPPSRLDTFPSESSEFPVDIANEHPPNTFRPQQKHSELTDSVVETFTPGTFRETFTSQVSTWTADIDAEYLDVVFTSYLTQEELSEFLPTQESRVQLQARQQQMQSDIAKHVENFLSDDTPGNREQKLTIIRETLSKTWSPDIADGIIKQLR